METKREMKKLYKILVDGESCHGGSMTWSLPKGEGWIWSPEFMGIFEKIKIRKRETFHPDREKLGDKFEMPELDAIDIQDFIAKFAKEAAPAKKGEKVVSEQISVIDDSAVREIRNQYESQLMQKDIEIRRLQGIIAGVHKALGSTNGEPTVIAPIRSDAIQMWVSKLGNGGPANILQFLAQRSGESFTRQQIALAVGASYSSVKSVWIPLLKRNLLIKEQGEKLFVNPDL